MIDISPLSNALGAEVTGLDLSRPLDDDTFARVHRAHLDHLVLVFRDQRLTPQEQKDFSGRFGPLDQHPADDATLPGHPEILLVSTRRENGAYIGLPDGGPMWHSDLAYRERTALGSMLYALEVPERGGNTGFANMYAAYDSLPDHLKAALVGTRGVFLAGRNNADRSFKRTLSAAQKAKTPPVSHPIVRTHPETGRRCIFANEQHTV
ncbi:MAG: TauD/TfdA family dioxygenase, partial [Pseudomonadota bacterium]